MESGGGVEQPLLRDKRRSFAKEFGAESKTLWGISGPAIFTYICQFSLGALTQTFTGQVGELELAAVSVENSVIAGLVFGAMGIWGGMIGGICLQTLILIGITATRNWDKEANEAEGRVKKWGGNIANN